LQPKVSVVIPCFNSIQFIDETLNSVVKQTYPNIEIIVIDDGSTDGTLEYLQSIYGDKITVKKNSGKGACVARNFGYKISTGDIIQFLDADDLLSIDKIEKQVAFLVQKPNHISVCSTKHFNESPENGRVTDRDFMFSTNQPAEFLLNLYGAKGAFEMVQTSAWLTPRTRIEKAGLWDESLTKDQDGEFFCRVVMASEGVEYEPNVLNYYRKHPMGSNIANQNQRKHLQSQMDALNSKATVLKPFATTDAYQNAMALQYKFLAINAFPKHKDISEKAINISRSFGGSDYLPVLGGPIIELLKSKLGWKFAKSVHNWMH
jgi:glycosyltransferase involved in cell wall biosynthesis